MSELSSIRPRWFRLAAIFGLLAVVFVDVEMYRWFRRTHDPAELLTCVGIAGAVTGGYVAWLTPHGRYQPLITVVVGVVIGLNLGWLLLLIAGVRQLMLLGLL